MTDHDLMQQVLEAIVENRHIPEGSDDDGLAEVITALRERLAHSNEFNPDWDAMAVMVEEQQRMAKRIEELEARKDPDEVLQIAEALRNVGLTLVRTSTGFSVMNLGQIQAQGPVRVVEPLYTGRNA